MLRWMLLCMPLSLLLLLPSSPSLLKQLRRAGGATTGWHFMHSARPHGLSKRRHVKYLPEG